jgi:hypothetical protein
MAGLVKTFDNCSVSELSQKLAHVSASLISLVVARRPSVSLAVLDERLLVPVLLKYIKSIVPMILMLPDDSENDYVGICAFLNVVPLLYHCGA